jgi:hypothetical protein
MRAWRRWLLSLALACGCCGGDDQPAPSARDAGRDAAEHEDAGASAPPDLHFSVIAFLLEIERGTRMSCPCFVRRGDYTSTDDCVEQVSFKAGWQDCVMSVALDDSLEVRDALHCALAELRQQNDCVEPTACPDDALPVCRFERMQCAKLDPSVLTQVVDACHSSIMLWH